MSSYKAAAIAFVCSLFASGAANASLLTIVETDFPGGGGSLKAQFTPEGSTPAGIQFGAITPESLQFTITPPAALPPTNFSVAARVLGALVEPGTFEISDQLTILGLDGGPPPSARFQFLSDSDIASLGLCLSNCIDETGTLQTLATVTFATGPNGATVLDVVTIQVQSDVEPQAVPEPGVVALLITAFGVFGLSRKHRHG